MKNQNKQDRSITDIETEAQETLNPAKPHYHKDENGFLVQCYHSCTKGLHGIKETMMSPAFWVATTLTWPIEHFLYEHVAPFSWIGKLMGH